MKLILEPSIPKTIVTCLAIEVINHLTVGIGNLSHCRRVVVDEILRRQCFRGCSKSTIERCGQVVIVITTKRGKIGAPQVRFHVEHSINEPTQLPEFLNAPDYMTLLNELALQDGTAQPFTQQQIDRTRSGYDPDLYPNVNWVDVITKDYAYTTRGNLDISGGSDFLRYSVVASYFKEGGILEQDKNLIVNNATNNQQFNLRTNIDMDVTKTTLLRVNIGGYLNRFKKQRCNTDDAFGQAFRTLTTDSTQEGWVVSFQEDTYCLLVNPQQRTLTGQLLLPWNEVLIAGSAFEGWRQQCGVEP